MKGIESEPQQRLCTINSVGGCWYNLWSRNWYLSPRLKKLQSTAHEWNMWFRDKKKQQQKTAAWKHSNALDPTTSYFGKARHSMRGSSSRFLSGTSPVHAPRWRTSGGLIWISCYEGVSSEHIIIVLRMQLSDLFSIFCLFCCVASPWNSQ